MAKFQYAVEFQSTPYCVRRHYADEHGNGNVDFNPRRTAYGDAEKQGGRFLLRISIHAVLRTATNESRYKPLLEVISIHAVLRTATV